MCGYSFSCNLQLASCNLQLGMLNVSWGMGLSTEYRVQSAGQVCAYGTLFKPRWMMMRQLRPSSISILQLNPNLNSGSGSAIFFVIVFVTVSLSSSPSSASALRLFRKQHHHSESFRLMERASVRWAPTTQLKRRICAVSIWIVVSIPARKHSPIFYNAKKKEQDNKPRST